VQVIVHGGAGGPADDPQTRQSVLDEAARAGAASDTVTAAVVAAIRDLETDHRFNAGTGAAVQSDGVIRTDAGVMTDDRKAGAVSAMPGVEHAVDVARIVKEKTPHVLISGVHAVDLAEAFDIPTGVDLWTPASTAKWADTDAPDSHDIHSHLEFVQETFGRDEIGGDGQWQHDTVGAVARAGDKVAAATSTGGRWCALAGRVGDVPQIGAGFYSARVGGASATGAGEDIARTTLARRAVYHLENSRTAQEAADLAITEFADLTQSGAGVIVMGNDGAHGSAYNTDSMQVAFAND